MATMARQRNPGPADRWSGGGRAHNYSPSGRPEQKSQSNTRPHGRFIADRPRAETAPPPGAIRPDGAAGVPRGPGAGDLARGWWVWFAKDEPLPPAFWR